MKSAIIVLAIILAGCATQSPAPESPPLNSCGTINTTQIRTDLANEYRTDREWYETIIKMLAWHIDCKNAEKPLDTKPS